MLAVMGGLRQGWACIQVPRVVLGRWQILKHLLLSCLVVISRLLLQLK